MQNIYSQLGHDGILEKIMTKLNVYSGTNIFLVHRCAKNMRKLKKHQIPE